MSSTRINTGALLTPTVEEWGHRSAHQRERIKEFHGRSSAEWEQIFSREADNNGVERPKGHKVSFHYNAHVENYHFGQQHPMKPWRLQLTKQLVLGTGLHYALDNYQTLPATMEQIQLFHSKEYVEFLSKVTPANMDDYIPERNAFSVASTSELNAGSDCPVFDGMWEYVSLYSGATIDAARALLNNQSDIAINWSGGLHHAHKRVASGFCYINDIVIAIIMMLKYKQRVLYVDIDVHHGDGVEEAFWSTDRVMTLSFHKYDPANFFPGTGGLQDTGPESLDNPGAHYSLNVPLEDGITDLQYTRLFQNIVDDVMEKFRPEAVVMQCGADSLGGDRLGKFNLNITAHGACVEHMKRKCQANIPLLLLGGGGYTPRNVARTWTHETALCVDINWAQEKGMHIPDHIPYRQAFEGNDRGQGLMYPTLDTPRLKHHNNNNDAQLNNIRKNIAEQLRFVAHAPSVQMEWMPRDFAKVREEEDQRLQDEKEERERDEAGRKRRERNIGGRGEHRVRGEF